MVIRHTDCGRRERAALMTELVVAMAILMFALLPLAYSIIGEKRLARATYQRAVAMEIVDGELEVLAAGGWHAFNIGTNSYPVRAGAATNLPPGEFLVTITAEKISLEWKPSVKRQGGSVLREVAIK